MEKIIDIIKGITFDDILRGLKHWYTFAILFCILSIIVLLILTCVLFKPDALKKQAKNTENSITFVSIYYEDKRIFTINDHNPKIPYKEYIDTFLGHFTKDKDDKRVALWLNELEKENHTVPHHLEVHTISNKKQPIYTILNVTFINYEKKIIHLEMRKFPNIKKIKKRKNSKIYVKHNNEMAELVSNNLHKPITLYLLRITTKNSKDVVESRLDHMTMTYAISRLTKYLSPTRYMCLLKTNEIVVVDLKMIPKNEAIALGHNLYSDMSKNIALTAFRQQYNYKVSIVQEKCNDLSFIELTKLTL
jgi:hypothetical protein